MMTSIKHLLVLILLSFFHMCWSFGPGPNNCVSNPCRSSAQCESVGENFVCHCLAGIRGKYCEKLLKPGEDVCGSSPCWNGGTCFSDKNNWFCVCPQGIMGLDCRHRKYEEDLVVKILNKGWFIAKLTLFYKRLTTGTQLIKQTGSIVLTQHYAFYLPFDVDISSIWLHAQAVAGPTIFNLQIRPVQPICIHVWGAVFHPMWTFMSC